MVLSACVAFAAVNSPLVFPPSLGTEQARRRSAADGRPVIHWRPGCRCCGRSRFTLGRDARRAHWVGIRRDPAAAASVRAVADGNETAPTVVLPDGQARVGPEPERVRELLCAAGSFRVPRLHPGGIGSACDGVSSWWSAQT
ncbi:hypothetical protein [Streptomyces albogriseolus]|uniref:hypothetical protein n=1 Tax=Streptomyces albogriseolus TaxID=1887 RepID=UPI0037956106